MKKIALLLVFVMILGCCFALSSCGDNSDKGSKEKTMEEKAQDKAEARMATDMALGMTLNGSEISFVSCTFATIKDLGNNNFKISGTVKARDQYGSFWVANYDTEVEYNSDSGEFYTPKINYGTFKKQ